MNPGNDGQKDPSSSLTLPLTSTITNGSSSVPPSPNPPSEPSSEKRGRFTIKSVTRQHTEEFVVDANKAEKTNPVANVSIEASSENLKEKPIENPQVSASIVAQPVVSEESKPKDPPEVKKKSRFTVKSVPVQEVIDSPLLYL